MQRTDNVIALSSVNFDASNPEHLQALDARIQSFSHCAKDLMVSDALIMLPILASTLLFVTGTCSLLVQLGLIVICAAFIYLSDMIVKSNALHAYLTDLLLKRNALHTAFQQDLTLLAEIYKRVILDNGYQITQQEVILRLLKAIAPYVETGLLWTMDSDNKLDYPEEFKKVLSSPPHRLPFNREASVDMSSLARSVGVTAIAFNYLLSRPLQPVDLSMYTTKQSIFNRSCQLFYKTKADLIQTLYPLQECKPTL